MTTAMPANPIGLRFMGVSKRSLLGSLYWAVSLLKTKPPRRISRFCDSCNTGEIAPGARRALELDHRAARCRHLAGDNHRATLGQMERRILLAINVITCRAIDRKDDLVAALCGARSRADACPLE